MPPGRTTRAISATPLARIGNEEDHQRHDGGIETAVGEGELHRAAIAEFRHPCRGPAACEGQLRLGWVDPLHLDGGAALDQ